jgi:hypothetical protein
MKDAELWHAKSGAAAGAAAQIRAYVAHYKN